MTQTTPRKRVTTDYQQPKGSFREVAKLTNTDPIIAGVPSEGSDNAPPKLAKRYKITMVHPKNGTTISGPGPRGPNKGDLPETWTFKAGETKYTPLYLSPEEAFTLMMAYYRERTRLNVPVRVPGGKTEDKTSLIWVHCFDIREEERI